MKRGDKVIVARRQSFTTRRKTVIATFLCEYSEGAVAVMLPEHDYPIHCYHTEVRPYSDALWAAWQQWERNAKTLDDQQQQLLAGRCPVELVTIGMW